jgi:hypothetical protein
VPQEENSNDSVLERLLRELQTRSEGAEDASMRTLFTEVRDELKKLNEGLHGDRDQRENDEEVAELARKGYTALKTRMRNPVELQQPRRKRQPAKHPGDGQE